MIVTICNFKGGVGKSMIAHQLITSFGYQGFEVDPYGSLADRLPQNVKRLDTMDELPAIIGDTIFDFGGFDCQILRSAITVSDLVIVPFIPTLETLQSTIDTLGVLKEYDKPILLVANLVKKQSDVDESKKLFDEFFGFELEIIELPDSIALQTAIAENQSVIELAKVGGLKAYTYKKAAQSIQNLQNKILEYVKC
jgi:chromosome partitioning protein